MSGATRIGRRAALLLPLGLAGCDTITSWFEDPKKPLPGKREPVTLGEAALLPDRSASPVTVPPPVENADWAQPGGNPTHVMQNLAARRLDQAWRSDIGESGGYRRRIPCAPIVLNGRVFTMDPDAVIRAFDLRNGGRIWQTETRAPKDRSTNVGGGISADGNTLYVATGRADVLALDPATGHIRWRKPIAEPARCAPTIADGRLFLTTMADRLLGLSASDGSQIWNYQATTAVTSVLGTPSPAYADGLVVAGFGSGDIVGVHADTGAVVWADSLASVAGNNLAEISAVRGLPAIDRNRVFAIGLGGLMLALDLRSGRRLWERDVVRWRLALGRWRLDLHRHREPADGRAEPRRRHRPLARRSAALDQSQDGARRHPLARAGDDRRPPDRGQHRPHDPVPPRDRRLASRTARAAGARHDQPDRRRRDDARADR